MPYMSSPTAYPPSSSPQAAIPAKRKRSPERLRSPLKPRTRGDNYPSIFAEDSDDDDALPPAQADGECDSRLATRDKENVPVSTKTTASAATCIKPSNAVTSHLGTSILSRDRSSPATDTTACPRETGLCIRTTLGNIRCLRTRTATLSLSYERQIAARSELDTGKAARAYYGINVNELLTEARAERATISEHKPSAFDLEDLAPAAARRANAMWTEKYRPKRFTDLVGDDRTHRNVMRWLKAWDSVVFPGSTRRLKTPKAGADPAKEHRKIMLLTGPPGLGKTTLAHVCAKQAGYEVAEINASDERSRDVVRGRIRDMLGTENVKSTSRSNVDKIARPICVIVDEVDGVVSGSGASGEGGFVKALMDLMLLDQKNAKSINAETASSRKRKGDSFRMLRPLIMICNDAYHPALRPLRTSHLVEIIHCGRPVLNSVACRVQAIFDKEGVGADADAVRKLCETCWGTTSKKEGGAGAGAGDGDIRSVLVMGEMLVRKFKNDHRHSDSTTRLTKKWIEEHVGDTTASGGVKGLGRGGSREIVDRIFMDGAGLSKPGMSTLRGSKDAATIGTTVKSVNEAKKAASSGLLRTLIDSHGETERIMTDLYTQYPSQPYQDDTFLTKPSHAYKWLHFHDALSAAVYSSSEWELAPYLSSAALAFHHFFATSSATRARYASDATSAYAKGNAVQSDEQHPFSTSSASFTAHEREKSNTALLQSLQESLSAPLTRLYPRSENMAAEFVPYLLRMLSPNVNPVLITTNTSGSGSGSNNHNSSNSNGKGASKWDNKTTASVRKASEKVLVDRAVQALVATGIRFDRHRVDAGFGFGSADQQQQQQQQQAVTRHSGSTAGGFVYRMNLALDDFGVYETGGKGFGNDVAGSSAQGNRYGVRQVLVQECAAEERRRDAEARVKRRAYGDGGLSAAAEEDDATDVGDQRDKRGVLQVDVDGRKKVKRDFFGRPIELAQREDGRGHGETARTSDGKRGRAGSSAVEETRIWVSYHEGYSNAVRKPITLAELMSGL